MGSKQRCSKHRYSRMAWWCLHCQKAYKTRNPYPQNCPFPRCDGGEADQIPWKQFREWCPGLPFKPQTGHVYAFDHPDGAVFVRVLG